MRIVTAGASGFLGSKLRAHLTASGHQVVQLVRRTPASANQLQWWPDQGIVDIDTLRGADAVVNLSGAGVQDKRWNDEYKKLLRTSRVAPSRTLARAIAELPEGERPDLLNGSAVGFYGDRGDEVLTEESSPGEGFLSDLAIAWEAATAVAEDAGARVVRLRTGLPLHRDGGLLKGLLLPFRLGVGGKLAGGRMWMPIMSMPDWLRAMTFLLERKDIRGPVNVCGPEPARNAELTTVLGRLLRRPTIAPIPGFAIRTVFGEVAQDLLASDRLRPKVLLDNGFTFVHPDVEAAVRAGL